MTATPMTMPSCRAEAENPEVIPAVSSSAEETASWLTIVPVAPVAAPARTSPGMRTSQVLDPRRSMSRQEPTTPPSTIPSRLALAPWRLTAPPQVAATMRAEALKGRKHSPVWAGVSR